MISTVVRAVSHPLACIAACLGLASAAFAQQPAEPAAPPAGPSALATSEAAAPDAAAAPVAGSKEAQLAAMREAFEKSINHRTGVIEIAKGAVTLNVPAGYYYLDRADARKVLEEAWGNPPDENIEGMLFAANTSAFDENNWGAVLTYADDGYVSDEDAHKINYDDLMREMQQAQKDLNPELIKEKYSPIEIVGWAAPPHYDAVKHKMYWAKDLVFDNSATHTLNYSMRVLGRKGVLELNFVADMAALQKVEAASAEVLAIPEFKPGYRYEEFDPKVDKKADYGLAGLVAGGGALLLAKKAGLLGIVLVFLQKAWVFIVAAFAGLGGVISRMFGGKGKAKPKTAGAGGAPASGSLDSALFGDKPAADKPPDSGPMA